MINPILDRYEDALNAHLTACNRFDIMVHRFIDTNIEMLAAINSDDRYVLPEIITRQGNIMEEFGIAIGDLSEIIQDEIKAVNDMQPIVAAME